MSLLLATALLAAAPLTENQAIDLAAKAMRQLRPSQPLACFAFQTEESSRRQFGIAVREKHNRRCGGDPALMPVTERFRVSRAPVRLWRWDVSDDSYLPCRLTAARRPVCPRLSYEKR
jgi:hypothetical protein